MVDEVKLWKVGVGWLSAFHDLRIEALRVKKHIEQKCTII